MQKPASAAHPIHRLIRDRWSPRAFLDKAVEPKLLLSLLEAARWAPSSFNEQPWVFLVATKEQPEEFEKMLGCLMEANQGWAKAAPVLMISVAKLSFTKNGKENRCALHDVGLASAMLTLQAVELGLSTHGMAGIEIEKIRSTYGVPEGYAPMAGWAVGYDGDPDQLEGGLREAEEAPRTRKDQLEFVYGPVWGKSSDFVAQ